MTLFLLIINILEVDNKQKTFYLNKIEEILNNCSDNQLAVVLKILEEVVPFLKT